jgi:hypothetical protein
VILQHAVVTGVGRECYKGNVAAFKEDCTVKISIICNLHYAVDLIENVVGGSRSAIKPLKPSGYYTYRQV